MHTTALSSPSSPLILSLFLLSPNVPLLYCDTAMAPFLSLQLPPPPSTQETAIGEAVVTAMECVPHLLLYPFSPVMPRRAMAEKAMARRERRRATGAAVGQGGGGGASLET
jgi:hypothetical protein